MVHNLEPEVHYDSVKCMEKIIFYHWHEASAPRLPCSLHYSHRPQHKGSCSSRCSMQWSSCSESPHRTPRHGSGHHGSHSRGDSDHSGPRAVARCGPGEGGGAGSGRSTASWQTDQHLLCPVCFIPSLPTYIRTRNQLRLLHLHIIVGASLGSLGPSKGGSHFHFYKISIMDFGFMDFLESKHLTPDIWSFKILLSAAAVL